LSRASDFWSRRKARVEAEAQDEARAAEQLAAAAREAELEEKTDAELCEELGLPDPDALKMGDDFRVFMDKAVPERLRRRALRRLWVSNPVLANLDGLNDYADDYTDAAMVVPGMKTTYQVGKGMLAHVQEMARQAEALARGPAEAEVVALADEPELVEVAEVEAAPDPDAGSETSGAFAEAETVTAQDDTPLPPRRRMRFQFDEQAGVSA